jgi:outer membrane lipoprotein-sorting protein
MMRLVALFALVPSVALADPKGQEILGKVDKMMNNFSDGVFESKLLVKEGTGAREYGFTTYQKSSGKRLVRFSSPGDIKGMGVLVENAETMYVFLPGFQRVRRMGTHIKNQTFMGSDFGFEDMSQTVFSPNYDANVVSDDGKAAVLELTAKKDMEYPKLRMTIDLAMMAPTKIEMMDGSGKKVKTQVREGYKKDATRDYYSPGRIVQTDHNRNHESEIDFVSAKLNTGLSDDLFTQRSLIRGQ